MELLKQTTGMSKFMTITIHTENNSLCNTRYKVSCLVLGAVQYSIFLAIVNDKIC